MTPISKELRLYPTNLSPRPNYVFSVTEDNKCDECQSYIQGIKWCIRHECYWGSSNYLSCHSNFPDITHILKQYKKQIIEEYAKNTWDYAWSENLEEMKRLRQRNAKLLQKASKEGWYKELLECQKTILDEWRASSP